MEATMKIKNLFLVLTHHSSKNVCRSSIPITLTWQERSREWAMHLSSTYKNLEKTQDTRFGVFVVSLFEAEFISNYVFWRILI